MDKTAPIQHTDQNDRNLHSNVAGHLNQAGLNTTPNKLNPNDETALENIRDSIKDLKHVADTTAGELVGGYVDYSRTVGNKSLLQKLKERFARKQTQKGV